jgi:hypothetical protein
MMHPIAYIIQDNIDKINKCWFLLLKLNLVIDMELFYSDKYFHCLKYATF